MQVLMWIMYLIFLKIEIDFFLSEPSWLAPGSTPVWAKSTPQGKLKCTYTPRNNLGINGKSEFIDNNQTLVQTESKEI